VTFPAILRRRSLANYRQTLFIAWATGLVGCAATGGHLTTTTGETVTARRDAGSATQRYHAELLAPDERSGELSESPTLAGSEQPPTRPVGGGELLPPRTAPALFRDPSATPERRARYRILRALQQSATEWLPCYERIPCRDEAEPARVEVLLVVRGGRVAEARATDVTEYRWDEGGTRARALAGDPEGPLVACLLDFLRSLSFPLPPDHPPYAVRFVFLPERAGGCEGSPRAEETSGG
jgi:hypothetical protein